MNIKTIAVFAAGLLLAGCVTRYEAGEADPSRLLVRETVFRSGEEPSEVREFSYSPAGQLIQEKLLGEAGRVREIATYSYSGGRVAERRACTASGELSGRRTYTYTAKGLPETESYYDGKGRLLYVSRFSYNYWGDTNEWTTSDAKGVLIASTRYTYEKGRLLTLKTIGAQGSETTVQMSYDAAGRKTRAAYTGATGKPEKEIAFSYDSQGRLAAEETFSAFGTPLGKTVYAYTDGSRQPGKIYRYDGRGNQRETIGFTFLSTDRS